MSRYGVWALLAGPVMGCWNPAVAQDAVASWYPLQPGETRTFHKEWRYGRKDHPEIEQWTTEETAVSAVAVPDVGGNLVTRYTKVLSHVVPAGFLMPNDSTKRELPESHLLVQGNCVYVLDGVEAQASACDPNIHSACLKPLDPADRVRPEYRDDLLRGKIPADYCFPLAVGMTWGKVATTSPAEEWVWNVLGLNADGFGVAGGRTFHMVSHLSSGTSIDRWFAEGIGVIQEVIEHHGTYDEIRRQLVKATIGGKTQSYGLTPARTVD